MRIAACRLIAVIMGTRPEAIKMAPVVHALRKRSDKLETVVVTTAQHHQMLDQVLSLFEITPDVDLDLMHPNQILTDLIVRVLTTMQATLSEIRPDLLLVQGDTTTVFASREAIVAEASRLLSDDAAYRATASGANPYGDGRAAERIAEALCRWSREQYPLLESAQEFQPTINTDHRELGMEYAH
jgi:UDP-N-acetylglucosamine 2-epimerase